MTGHFEDDQEKIKKNPRKRKIIVFVSKRPAVFADSPAVVIRNRFKMENSIDQIYRHQLPRQ
jgi:hypothetical protein